MLDLLSPKNDTKVFDLRAGAISETTIDTLLPHDAKVSVKLPMGRLWRLLMLSDSANFYGSILSGHPKLAIDALESNCRSFETCVVAWR